MLRKCLDEKELYFAQNVNKEVNAYIYNMLVNDNTLTQEAAVEEYFSSALRISKAMGDMGTACPSFGYTKRLFDFFEPEVISRFLDYDAESGHCAIRKDGKYMELLRRMSRRNGFFKGFYEYMLDSDGCTGVPYIVAINYRNVDFTREDESFIAFLALLTRPDFGAVPFAK